MIILTHCIICGEKADGGWNDEDIVSKIYKKFPEKDNDYYGPSVCTCSKRDCNNQIITILNDVEIAENKFTVYNWKDPCAPYNVPRSNGNVNTGGEILNDPNTKVFIDLSRIMIPIKWQTKENYLEKLVDIKSFCQHNYHVPLPIIRKHPDLEDVQNKIIKMFIHYNRCLMDVLVANSREYINENSSPFSLLPIDIVNIVIRHYYGI